MARLPGLGVARNVVAVVFLVVFAGIALFAYVRPDGTGGNATNGPTDMASVPTPQPTETEPSAIAPPARDGATDPPRAPATPTPAPDEGVVAFTNPDGPDRADSPPDAYPFIETANTLPTFGGLWVDDNQRDFHIALTGDIEGAIEALRDGVPRGVTVYFHLVEYSQAEICALRDAMFEDRDELMRHGIVLTSGGCGNAQNRVSVGLSPHSPEVIAFMTARYDGPIDYEPGGWSALRAFEPVDIGEVRLLAVHHSDDLGLLTCGRRPFPAAALESEPGDISANDPESAALREGLSIYVDVYGDMTSLGWILAESDDFGATFIANRGDTWLEAPVFASRDSWVPGTIDHCSPRPLTLEDGSASVYLDPAFPKPAADATKIHVLVEERACAGGSSPASRLLPPIVRYDEAKLTLTFGVRGVGGPATCPGNPRLPVTIVLPEPLGDRELRGINPLPKH